MEIYNSTSKQLYTTTVYRLDENNKTCDHFNLQYDGAIFFGLYSAMCHQSTSKSFPSGTLIQYKHPDDRTIHGFVLAIPCTKLNDICRIEYVNRHLSLVCDLVLLGWYQYKQYILNVPMLVYHIT